MQNLKYRVWDKLNKKMHYEIHPGSLMAEAFVATAFNVPITEAHKDLRAILAEAMETQQFVFMQYTGRKDKDNTDIYDGDILATWIGKGKSRKQVFHTVNWNDYGWFMPHPVSKFEIVGNVYQNPS